MRFNDIILQPIITEKSVDASSAGKYVFKVRMSASKGLIAKKVSEMFKVDAVDVHTIIVPGKPKRILGTRRYKKAAKWKKAIVKLKTGQKIDLFPKE